MAKLIRSAKGFILSMNPLLGEGVVQSAWKVVCV